MRNAWLMGLLIFCAVASGFILVQGRSPEQQGPLTTTLLDQATVEARELAGDLGLAEAPDADRSPGTFYRYTDATGTMRFVTSLAEVPAALRGSARAVGNDRVQRAPAAPAGTRVAKRRARMPAEAAIARAMQPEVIVYTTSW
jgi:hypothetical protein